MPALTEITDLLAEFQGAIPITLHGAVRRSVRRFCEDTWWHSEERTIDLEAPLNTGIPVYSALPLVGDAQYDLIAVTLAKWNEAGYAQLSPAADIDDLYSVAGGILDGEGKPSHYAVEGRQIAFSPTPDTTYPEIIIRVTLRPAITSTEINDQLWEEWHEALLAGARSELFSQSNQPWHNPDAVYTESKVFRKAVARAKTRKARGNTNRQLRMTVPRFL